MIAHFAPAASRAWAVQTGLTVVIALCLTASYTEVFGQSGQQNRILHATVADPLNRYVTGLTPDHFEVFENGFRRPVLSVLTPDDPIFVAVVNEREEENLSSISGPVEVFQTRSLQDALSRWAASVKPRKALILTSSPQSQALPGGIFATIADPSDLRKAVIEVCNQYAIGFESTDPSIASELVLKQPAGLPPLKTNIRK